MMSDLSAASAALVFLLLLPGRALGHGKMLVPVPRQPEPMYWYQVGCQAGCVCSGGGKETYPSLASMKCETPAAPTLAGDKRTWNIHAASPKGDWNKYMPWRAPGTSVPLDACGIASGFDPKAAVQYPHSFAKASGVKQGDKGSELKVGKVTEWEAGATVTASWTLVVNHGGGYQYRVCPTGGGKTVTNDCFEENPLAFADDKQTVHFSAEGSDPVTITATDVAEGVRPAGATWRRLPIPACACDLGSGCTGNSSKPNATADYVPYGKDNSAPAHGACKNGLQFEAPHLAKDWPDGFGYYVSKLGKAAAAKKGGADSCASYATEEACGDAGGACTWYGPKSTCYTKKGTKRRGLKDPDKTDKCAAHKTETPCADATGCAWYASKSECYSDGSDAKDFSGNSAVAYGDSEWWISDALVAPTELGSYVLQWRWDNEQTPQIWTTCADVQVVAKKESGAEARHRGVGLLCSMAAVAAAAAALLVGW